MKISRVFVTIIVVNLCALSQEELFSALSDLEPLLETQRRIIEDLDDYVSKNESNFSVLKSYLKVYKREHAKAMDDVTSYLSNPISAFTLIKRLTTDLILIKQSIDERRDYIKKIDVMDYPDAIYPTLEDLTGAANALTRLQRTYKLDVADLAEGIINGVTYSSQMNTGDCYNLGRILYKEKDFTNALAWMMAALGKFNEDNEYPLEETDILEYISSLHYSLGNVTESLKWSEKILKIQPKHYWALRSAAHFQRKIKRIEERKRLHGDSDEKISLQRNPTEPDWYTKEKKEYEAICRGEQKVQPQLSKRLKCRYLSETHPFLRLAPVKMEYKYLNPDIVMLYDVLSDEEIEEIKRLAKPRLNRAGVHTASAHTVVDPSSYRISKSAWLNDLESPVVERVSRRAADVTGLDLTTAEELQVVNYGIGGHYSPHYDFAAKNHNYFKEDTGNRIATVLFYLSDVAQGGATVFTELGLSLVPVRGAAAVWFNLHASGEGNMATRHAGCPVLVGYKWVCSKWIHLVGQEFIKPCDLNHQKQYPT